MNTTGEGQKKQELPWVNFQQVAMCLITIFRIVFTCYVKDKLRRKNMGEVGCQPDWFESLTLD